MPETLHIGVIIHQLIILKDRPKQQVDWQPGRPPKHQLKWSEPCGLVHCGIIGEGERFQMLRPSVLGLGWQGSYHSTKGAI